MGFVQGAGRTQGTLFPVTLEELIPDDHVCPVIDAFVDRLDMAGLGLRELHMGCGKPSLTFPEQADGFQPRPPGRPPASHEFARGCPVRVPS
jgi:hypothetical protein